MAPGGFGIGAGGAAVRDQVSTSVQPAADAGLAFMCTAEIAGFRQLIAGTWRSFAGAPSGLSLLSAFAISRLVCSVCR